MLISLDWASLFASSSTSLRIIVVSSIYDPKTYFISISDAPIFSFSKYNSISSRVSLLTVYISIISPFYFSIL